MGLYIDMEMPQSCQSCNFYNGLGCEATGRMFSLLYNVATRRSDCPLTEVHEPHGRLIYADELIEFIENRYEITWKDDYEGGIKDACVDILEKISTMPTVIPASDEG